MARRSPEPDYLGDGVTGFLGNSNAELSAALRRLIGQKDLRDKMGVAAAKHAQQFDWDRIREQWQEIMECAVVHRHSGGREKDS